MHHLTYHHGPALEALHALRYSNKEVQDSVKELAKEGVHDFIAEVNKLDIDDNTKHDIAAKLNTLKYVIGYPDLVLDLQKIEEYYDELELNGTEGLVETYLKTKRYNEKIRNNPDSNWKMKLTQMTDIKSITFITNDNILCEFK